MGVNRIFSIDQVLRLGRKKGRKIERPWWKCFPFLFGENTRGFLSLIILSQPYFSHESRIRCENCHDRFPLERRKRSFEIRARRCIDVGGSLPPVSVHLIFFFLSRSWPAATLLIEPRSARYHSDLTDGNDPLATVMIT